MTAKEILDVILKQTDNTQITAAEKANWTLPRLRSKLSRNSLTAEDYLHILDSIGVDIVYINRETQEPINFRRKGAGRPVKGQVNFVKYDTEKSEALANNFYADGVNEYTDGKAMELYISSDGKYFFAEYSCLEGTKDRISPCSETDAAAFMKKYGGEIHKGPKTE